MSKIARDLNIKNIEERVFELEKNPGGGISEVPLATDEAVGGFKTGNGFSVNEDGNIKSDFIEENFISDKTDCNVGTSYIEDNEIKTIYSDFNRNIKENLVVKNKEGLKDIDDAYLQIYINGYFNDLTDNTQKVTPVYDTVNYVVDYDLTKIPNIDKFLNVGRYNSFQPIINSTLKKGYKMIPQAESIDKEENSISIYQGLNDFYINLYLYDFEEKIAFSNTNFKLRLKIAETIHNTTSGDITRNGFQVDYVQDAILTHNRTLFNPLVRINNSFKLDKVSLVSTQNTVGENNIYETFIIIDDINISEIDFLFSALTIHSKCDGGYIRPV